MDKYTRFSPRASLAAIGVRVRQMKVWHIVGQQVHIKQKVIRHRPLDKLLDAWISILAGGQGLVEVNTRVRPDRMLQKAFGREACADQSTISDTLNVCQEGAVLQMREALQHIYRIHGRGYRHRYEESRQVLDVDMTGMPAGRQGEGVTKGYFSEHRGQRGRQLGRVVATLYDEIVVERLYPGKVQLERSLQELVSAAEGVLELDDGSRSRTVVRVDGGGGRDADINWLLRRGYHVVAKVKNWQRSVKLARSVKAWYPDPKVPGREAGWIEEPHPYHCPTRQVGIRKRKKNGQWQYRIVVFTLNDEMLFCLAGQPVRSMPTPQQVLFAAVHVYDLRGGGVETTVKGSKQGLGLTKRNKRRFHAQEMLVLLAQLAYNLITWTRNLLACHAPQLGRLGILRIVRDLFHIAGTIQTNTQGQIVQIRLNEAHSLAPPFTRALSAAMPRDGPSLSLGQI